jgi:hypothetical protein
MSFRRSVKISAPALALALLWVGGGCSGGSESEGQTDPDTLTRAQKDSLISTMPIPGAGAVGKALEASEKARARAEQHDTMG